MPNDLNDLWSPPSEDVPQPVPTTPAPAEPSADDIMARRIGALEGMVTSLAGVIRGGMMAPVPQPGPSGPPEGARAVPQQWEDKEYLSPDDIRSLLDSQEPHKAFNRAINSAAKQTYESVMGQVNRTGREVIDHVNRQSAAMAAVESRRTTDNIWKDFFTRHSDLVDYRDMLESEAMRQAREYQANPTMGLGMSVEQVWDRLAGNVRNRLESIRGSQSSTTASGERASLLPPTSRRSSAPFMERGGAPRAPAKPSTAKPGTTEGVLEAMDRHLRSKQ